MVDREPPMHRLDPEYPFPDLENFLEIQYAYRLNNLTDQVCQAALTLNPEVYCSPHLREKTLITDLQIVISQAVSLVLYILDYYSTPGRQTPLDLYDDGPLIELDAEMYPEDFPDVGDGQGLIDATGPLVTAALETEGIEVTEDIEDLSEDERVVDLITLAQQLPHLRRPASFIPSEDEDPNYYYQVSLVDGGYEALTLKQPPVGHPLWIRGAVSIALGPLSSMGTEEYDAFQTHGPPDDNGTPSDNMGDSSRAERVAKTMPLEDVMQALPERQWRLAPGAARNRAVDMAVSMVEDLVTYCRTATLETEIPTYDLQVAIIEMVFHNYQSDDLQKLTSIVLDSIMMRSHGYGPDEDDHSIGSIGSLV